MTPQFTRLGVVRKTAMTILHFTSIALQEWVMALMPKTSPYYALGIDAQAKRIDMSRRLVEA